MVVPACHSRVVILHNVIVETEGVLGCLKLEWLPDAEKITSDGMMNKQTQTFNF